jgi:ubiquinone/menaquinone biosynthesis C-methylase UbiE
MDNRGVKTILDIGCGRGSVLKCLNMHGFKVTGTEVASDLFKRELAGCEVYPCAISEMPCIFQDNQFDFVLSVDVLDHVAGRDAVLGAKESWRIASMGVAAVVNGDEEGQLFRESLSMWELIFKDISGIRPDVRYGRGGAAMVYLWK